MTDKELQSLSDVFDGIFIGAAIFIVLLVIGFFIWQLAIRIIEWLSEYIQNKNWLYKRNKHRKKCGLTPIKKLTHRNK